MTSLIHTPAALAAYLRRATWGLPRARQQELWDELEEHVLTRADHLCGLGADPEQALSQALRELGPPARVSAGMTQVYLMPKMILAATASALALSAALYALAGGNEGSVTLPVLTQRPAKPTCVRGTKPTGPGITIVSEKDGVTCYTFNDPAQYAGAYIRLDDLRKVFEQNGVTATAIVSSPRGALNLKYPDGTRRVLWSRFQQNGQYYTDAAYLLQSALGTPAANSLRLSGYDNPILTLGKTRLQLGTNAQAVEGATFYGELSPILLSLLTNANPAKDPVPDFGRRSRELSQNAWSPLHTVQTQLRAGEVVMFLARNGQGGYFLDLAPVGQDGKVTLGAQQRNLRFVSSIAQLSPYPSGGRVPALLVRVTNVPLRDLKKGIFLPAQPTSDAAR